jgi:hypothetical protein
MAQHVERGRDAEKRRPGAQAKGDMAVHVWSFIRSNLTNNVSKI